MIFMRLPACRRLDSLNRQPGHIPPHCGVHSRKIDRHVPMELAMTAFWGFGEISIILVSAAMILDPVRRTPMEKQVQRDNLCFICHAEIFSASN